MQAQLSNGIRIAYARRGQGMPLVLVHGFPLDRHAWDALAPQLEDRADLIMPDLRGMGESGGAPRDQPYGIAEMAADMAGLLDALGLERVLMAGHSMGGYVAMAFARAYPQRLGGLGLVATQALPDTPERRAGRYATAGQVAEQGVQVVADAMAPKLTANPGQVPDIHAAILRQPAAGVIGALKAMAERPDSSEVLSKLKIPVTIVVGQADALIPTERSREMKALIPQAVLTELPGVGHSPMLEAPAETAKALQSLLA